MGAFLRAFFRPPPLADAGLLQALGTGFSSTTQLLAAGLFRPPSPGKLATWVGWLGAAVLLTLMQLGDSSSSATFCYRQLFCATFIHSSWKAHLLCIFFNMLPHLLQVKVQNPQQLLHPWGHPFTSFSIPLLSQNISLDTADFLEHCIDRTAAQILESSLPCLSGSGCAESA